MRGRSKGVMAIFLAAGSVFMGGCAYYPRVTDEYDMKCGSVQKRFVMEKSDYGMQRHCTNEACIAELMAIPVEAVVVGSVVVVGNTILWLQRVGDCD